MGRRHESENPMSQDIVPRISPDGAALSAEHYQSFDMAKQSDGVIGGDDIAQIRSYAAYARAQAQAIHKTIAATQGIEDVAAIKAEATETAQTFARVGIYADQRIGELLREMPKATNQHDARQVVGTPTSTRQAEREAGIGHSTSIDLQAMAANPEIVQAVIDRATEEGTVVSRAQVLKAIRERDEAREEVEQYGTEIGELQREIAALEGQVDSAYEDGYKAAQAHQGTHERVITREVVPDDYERIKRENERLSREYQAMWHKKQESDRRLAQANELLGMDKTLQDVQRDVQYLISATNNYVRRYGGLTWTAASFEQVDAQTIEELRKAATNLATFSNALVASLEEL